MTNNDESRLDELFQKYRAACPVVEPGSNFMPDIWRKIESRYSFWFVFQRLARTAMTVCAALCLILLALNFDFSPQAGRASATYTDALLADHSAETTYYTEAMPSTLLSEETSGTPRR